MASRRQWMIKALGLEDALAYEKAKVNTAIKMYNKLRNEGPTQHVDRMNSYWFGYWAGQKDSKLGILPEKRPDSPSSR